MGKKFVGLDGLKHYWQKIKTKIEESQKIVTDEIAKEVTARTNADTLLQTAINGKSDVGHTHTKSQITDFAHNHDDRYFTETEVTNKLAGKSDTGHMHTKSEIMDFAHTHDDRYFTKTEITNKLAEKSDTGHTHDDRYFTETEITNKLAGKSDTGHNHDDRYYTESEIDTKLSNKVDKVSGKGLSTNDYTTAEKNKLAGLKNYDDTEVRGLIEDETTRATTAENNLSTSINGVKSSAVISVNYDSTNKKITKTINGTKSDVVTLATMKTAMALNNVTNVATESTITKDSTKNITSGAVYTLKQTVDSNKSAIATLNGTGTGSVKKTVTDEIAKVVANAPADFDTLKEISDWIDTHEDSASAMNTAISKNATNLSNHINNKSNPHSVTKAQVGLGNVGNFKAVSTVANQGLTDAEKANARANIGAGMSSFSGSYTDLKNKPTSLKNPNALTVNGKTYDGSSAVNAGVQTVANGGTGQTTAKAALNSFINSLDTGSSVPVDNDYYVSQYVNGGTTNTTYVRRPMSLLWEYIKGKISSVLGLTATAYSGKASTAGTADKTKNDITMTIPNVTESGQYVIPLGNILEPTSTEINSPYNWDITGFFSIIRGSGHNGSHIKFEAGHGYSHAWRTYAYLDSENFNNVSTSMKAFQYNGKWWLGLYISTLNQNYVGKMTITYSRGLLATPTCILYNSKSGGVANEEIYNSIQDIPSSWWRPRTIHNPTTFVKDITAPNITSLEESVAGKSDIGHTHTKSEITDFAHTHDDRYYTETEIDTKLNKKQDKITITDDYSTTLTDDNVVTYLATGTNPTEGKRRKMSQVWTYIKGKADSVYAKSSHTHDDRYFTETEVTNKLAGKSDTGHTHTKSQITDFPTSLPANGGTADYAKGLKTFASWNNPYVYDETNGIRLGVFKITMPSNFNSILIQIYDDINYAWSRKYILGLWHKNEYGYNVSVTDLGGTITNGLRVWLGNDGNVYLQSCVHWTSRISFSYLEDITNITVEKIGFSKVGSNTDLGGNVLFTPLTDPIIDSGAIRGLPDLSSATKATQYLKADRFTGSLNGNSATATKLETARTINIQDSSATNTGTGASFDGSENATIKLPATIKADITGNVSGSSGSCTGNSATATTASKVANSLTFGSKTFNGSSAQEITASDLGALTAHQTIKQDGITGATVNRFGTCSTAAATAAKTVSITTGTFSLEAGARVSVKFSNANTASTPTLNVAGKGAKNIFHKGAQITTGGNKALLTGVCDFIYDGAQWHLIGNYIDTNTTYSNFVKSGSGAKSGLVPAPSTTAGTTKYLREDGTWTAPPNTTYSSKSAASGGTDVSLVTTGEKYTWNSKAAGTHYHTNLKPSNHDTNDVDYYPMWANGIGDGSTARSVYTSTDLKYNPKNKTLKSTNFSGNLSGTASNAVTATTALKIPTSQPAATLEAGHIWVI